jgi:anti-sigma regulatory factor (Ser/Thr protein kinase)/N-acetylglutamate synthase-like GNAT family acetyltransferase
MDQTLTLHNHANIIGPATDFAYKWGLNVGLSDAKSMRLALAVDELVTDVVRFAFPRREATFTVTFRADLSTAEVILHERGEPFDPARHPYDPAQARAEGNFEGAGFAVMQHCVDDFVFLNRGREGKEFRLVQHIEAEHIADRPPSEEEWTSEAHRDGVQYHLSMVSPDDAEAVAKLIYRTYDYTYAKEDLYYPDRIARALDDGSKFGVLLRTDRGRPVGYFAVLQAPDSEIGEVGEAVVAPNHRRRGLMKRMLHALIDEAEARGMLGVFGEAVTVHDISQRVNHHFGMVSTALLLGIFPPERFLGLAEDSDHPITVVIDFRPLEFYGTVAPFLPAPYANLLTSVYDALGATVVAPSAAPVPLDAFPATTHLDAQIQYTHHHVVFVIEDPGADLVSQVQQALDDLTDEDMHVAFVDLPLNDPCTPVAADLLRDAGFVLAGLMPRFHHDRDFLRMQRPLVALDPADIRVYSDLAITLKSFILDELSWSTNGPETP